MNTEMNTICRFNRSQTNRYASRFAASLVIWAAFLWWLFGY
jgi:hypothetical protein